MSARDDCRHRVEIADTDFTLMTGRGVALRLRSELDLLQFAIGGHTAFAVIAGQIEHRQTEAVKARQGHELEAVAHLRDVVLKTGDLRRRQRLAPIEARRAVVSQHFAGEFAVYRIRKTL